MTLTRALPVPVEPRRGGGGTPFPGGVRGGDHRKPGRRHQGFLRAGGDHVYLPGVRLQRDGAEARDRVHDAQRMGLARGGGERLQVGDDAGRGFGVREEDSRGVALA